MRIDERIAIKTINTRKTAPTYSSRVVRFGTSDAVSLVGVNTYIETFAAGTSMVAVALSRNPEHELVPPADVATFAADEAIYAIQNWFSSASGGSERLMTMGGSKYLPLNGIIVPSRQVYVMVLISGSNTMGIVSEYYYRNVTMSKEEAQWLNASWGKYRR